MFSYIYHLVVFDPLYNGLIFLMDIFPWMDAGIAVIIFTIVIRLILFPLSKKAIVTQVRMKEVEPELKKIRESKSNDRQAQAVKMMALYKEKGISPFSSFFVLLIQIPIIYALYSIFMHSGLPVVNETLLYSFVATPIVDMNFLGLLDISQKSILFAIIAAIAQYFQLHFSLAAQPPKDRTPGSQMDMAYNMTKNMKYIFPVVVFVISYSISAVVPIYWTASSLFTLGQELVVRKHLAQHKPL